MMNIDAYKRTFEMMLRENQVTLFDCNGSDRRLDYQRHIDTYVRRFQEQNVETFASRVLQLTLDLWGSWEIHIKQSVYSTPHFGGVHVEHRWVTLQKGAPPCAMLSNFQLSSPEEQDAECPIHYVWKYETMLGAICCRTFSLADVGKCYRFYLESCSRGRINQ